MDEITLFAEIRPEPPADAASLRQGAHDRLAAAMSAEGGPAASGGPASGGPAAAWPRRSRPGWLRRPRLVLAGAVTAAAACAAIVVPALAPGGATAPFVTSAWAVQRHPDGTVTITIREARNPAGLQRALRQAGLRARVASPRLRLTTRHGQRVAVPVCTYPRQGRLFEPRRVQRAVVKIQPAVPGAHGIVAVIRPAAMPTGSVLFIVDSVTPAPARPATGTLTASSFSLPTVLRGWHLPRCR